MRPQLSSYNPKATFVTTENWIEQQIQTIRNKEKVKDSFLSASEPEGYIVEHTEDIGKW